MPIRKKPSSGIFIFIFALARLFFNQIKMSAFCFLFSPFQTKIFAQILLTFRYGRDDEEVMGLKLSNESVLCVEQICPLLPGSQTPRPLTKCQVRAHFYNWAREVRYACSHCNWANLQEVLMQRLGPQAHIVNLKLHHAVPASVRLLPAKEYNGAAIGISYDLKVYIGEIQQLPIGFLLMFFLLESLCVSCLLHPTLTK